MTQENQLVNAQSQLNISAAPHSGKCPKCGHCPHCGRSTPPYTPWYPPYNPYAPYWQPAYPYYTVASGTNQISPQPSGQTLNIS